MADPTVTLLASSTSATATTTASFSAQTAGTLLVLTALCDDYRTTSGSNRPEGNGWTIVPVQTQQNVGHYMWWKIASGSETSVAYTIGSASKSAYQVLAATNIDGTGTYDTAAANFKNSFQANWTTGSITPSAGRKLTIAAIGGSTNGTAVTGLGSWTNSYVSTGTEAFGQTSPQMNVGTATLALDGGTATSTGATWTGGGPGNISGIIASFAVSAGGGSTDVALTGAVVDLALSAPDGTVTATSVVNVSLTGVVCDLATAAPAGTVSTSSVADVALTGAVANLAVTSPAGTVTAGSTTTNVALTGVLVDVGLASPVGTVDLTTNVADSGSVAGLTFAAPAGTVTATSVGNVALTGVVATVALTAPAGTVSASGGAVDVDLTGVLATLTVTAPAGTVAASGSAADIALTGDTATLTLTAPAGTVTPRSDINLTGEVSALSLAALAGSVALTTLVALTGEPAGIDLTAYAGTVSAVGANDGTPVRNPRLSLTSPSTALTLDATQRLTLTTPTPRLELT